MPLENSHAHSSSQNLTDGNAVMQEPQCETFRHHETGCPACGSSHLHNFAQASCCKSKRFLRHARVEELERDVVQIRDAPRVVVSFRRHERGRY